MAKVVTMGEIMLRLSTPGFEKFIQADNFDVCYGGGEANVAVSLANYGHDASFVTKVPKNEIGDCAVAALNKMGVDTKNVAHGGDRLGIYFLETGAAMRASKVVYDRAHSAIAEAEISDFDFDKIFEGADWFHFTGITPAVSDKAAEVTEAALKAAKAKGITVSVDLNFRKKLWSSEKAQKVMTNLMQYVDVCIGNEEDAEKVLGFKPGNTDVTSGDLELAGYEDIFKQMVAKFNFKYVVSSLRESYSASDNGWSACIYNGETSEFYHSRKYRVTPIVDRVGGGDSFAAGVICGLVDGKDFKSALEFGVAASALKHTIPGDFNLVTRPEVDALVGGDGSGRVQR
ncbi:sugar kinase [Lachnoclostridium phytofermentans]|uniref:PfkB domain protein n=1 Tax=Lachnoclostridium phytofermentans (strain ATCC 700394 / DSM 18823 / ISDg) TaxID=357809 RepID=A9KNI3_LACP7|nr:sugar kinase [Lachnoclostridium phytofermentans]ABX43100.1 PfkB domain protein [Lachnoclostridium phytofermentans ISDg]